MARPPRRIKSRQAGIVSNLIIAPCAELPSSIFIRVQDLAVTAREQVPEGLPVNLVADEVHGAIGEDDIGATRMHAEDVVDVVAIHGAATRVRLGAVEGRALGADGILRSRPATA